jgi:ech hydrogenase subunit A
LIILCAGLNTSLSYVAALTLLIFHSVSKGLLFLSAGVVENRVHTRLIEDWEGLLGKLPFTSIMMIVGMLSMFLPPFGMLLGKWIAIDAVTTSPLFTGLILIVLLLVGSTATTIYYSKWLGHLTVLPQADVKPKAEKLSPLFTLSMGVLLALSILMGTSVALVMNLLVIPALPINYFASISADLIRVSTIIGSTTIGTFITYPFWVAASGIFLIGYFIYRSKGGVIKPPYVSGENIAENPEVFMTTADSQVPIELSGMFFDNEISNTWLWNYGVMAGAVILFIMFLTVVF